MKRIVEFIFDTGEKVKIKAINMTGNVDSLLKDREGTQYRVVYWNDGERYSVWMYEWELEGIQQNGKV